MTERIGNYEVHPFAATFPLLEGEEFDQLVDDVKRNGLREPILLSHDKQLLIDGRNRLRACDVAGVDVVHEALGAHYTEFMTLDLIMSLNVKRRQLTSGQRGGVAQEYERYFAEAIKAEETARKLATPSNQHTTKSSATSGDPQKSQPKDAAKAAAKAAGTSEDSVRRMKRLKTDAPDLHAAVMANRISLDAADKQARARRSEQKKHEPEPEKPKPQRAEPIMLTLRTHTGDPVSYPQPQSKPSFNHTPGAGISWADWSWNPVTGCLHGCDYCYAREIATSERYSAAYPVGFTPLFHHERLDAPANTTLPVNPTDAQRRVFVCSMADLYGRWVPQEWIDQVHAAELASPQWQYIHLTKFPDRYVGLDLPPSGWIGTSVDEQKRVRIAERAFSQIEGVAVKWLSLEPLREPLEFTDLSMFDWVVIGAQTATRQPSGVVPAFAPPIEWVSRIIVQALDSGCKVHCKPNLASGPGVQWLDQYPAIATS